MLERYRKLMFLLQMSSLVTTKPHVEALDRGNDNKDQSHFKTGLTRSKSMGSLQIKVVSFQSLKARFESKEDTQKKVTSKQSTSRSVEATQEKTAEAKQVKMIKPQQSKMMMMTTTTSLATFLHNSLDCNWQSPWEWKVGVPE